MKNNSLKKKSGITLIALVITIIVLIILAGVTISLVVSENGLLDRAKYAKEEYNYAQSKERLEIQILDVQTKILEEQSRIATLEDLQQLIDLDKYEITLYYKPIATIEKTQTKATYAEVKEKQTMIVFTVDMNLKIRDVKLIEKEDDYVIPYEGKGYLFIYDGSLNSEGIDGLNMQNELTGGWSTARTPVSCNAGKNYHWYLGYVYTNNKIDLSNYSKLYISSYIQDSSGNFLYGGQIQKTENNLIMPPVPNIYFDFDYTKEGENFGSVDIPENWNGYIGTCSHHSTSQVAKFEYNNKYIRNICDSTRYMDLYELFAVKEDDWKKWTELGQVDINNEKYNSMQKILQDGDTLTNIFTNEKANNYLLKCSGTLMVEILKDDNSYNCIPSDLKEKMKDNENWNKFARIFNRAL